MLYPLSYGRTRVVKCSVYRDLLRLVRGVVAISREFARMPRPGFRPGRLTHKEAGPCGRATKKSTGVSRFLRAV